jgi:hypothetical protein
MVLCNVYAETEEIVEGTRQTIEHARHLVASEISIRLDLSQLLGRG